MVTTAGPWPIFGEKPTIPYFETEAERDRRYAEWVAEGNAMVDGMWCFVADGGRRIYSGGKWWKQLEAT